MKRRIKLTESDLHRIIKESVKKVLKEDYDEIYDYFSNDNDVNNMRVFDPIESGYINNISFDEYLEDIKICILKNVIKSYKNLFIAYNKACSNPENVDGIFYNTNIDMDLYNGWCYDEHYSGYDGINNVVNNVVKNVIEDYKNDVTEPNNTSSFENGYNDYDYPNKNYDDFDVNDPKIFKKVKSTLFNDTVMKIIKKYVNTLNAMENSIYSYCKGYEPLKQFKMHYLYGSKDYENSI